MRNAIGLLGSLAALSAMAHVEKRRAGLSQGPLELDGNGLALRTRAHPLGVDLAVPDLFWKLEGSERDERQTAYQIRVAATAEALAMDHGDLWDSDRVISDETTHIAYQGRPLKSSQQAFWKVRVWDKDGNVSAWSPPAVGRNQTAPRSEAVREGRVL